MSCCRSKPRGDRSSSRRRFENPLPGKVAGLGIDVDERDGLLSVVIGCTREQHDRMQSFYALLTAEPAVIENGGTKLRS